MEIEEIRNKIIEVVIESVMPNGISDEQCKKEIDIILLSQAKENEALKNSCDMFERRNTELEQELKETHKDKSFYSNQWEFVSKENTKLKAQLSEANELSNKREQ